VTEKNISTSQIEQQLNTLLNAAAFQHSATLSRFLKYVVDMTLMGRQIELKEYTIAVHVLGKKTDFNPQTDPIVRIHAGRLRRVLHEYYQHQGLHDEVMIDIPKGTYIPTITLAENNEVLNRTNTESPEVTLRKITVAVLPFSNFSTSDSSIAFADGLGDHLCTELTRYSELSVISYFSSRNIVSKINDIRDAGMMLDAQFVLTGSVQSDQSKLRIRVQLILTDTREQIWANSYESNSTIAHLFEIQDEIVWQVVSQTAGHYGAISRNIAKHPSPSNLSDLGVYNAIYWYYRFVNNLTVDMFYKAEATMAKAVATDPSYALGWAVLGEMLIGGFFMGYKSKIANNQLETAVQYGRNAIKADPTCQHGYQTIALANIFLHNKMESLKAIEEWNRLKPPEAGIMGAIGFIAICCGEYEKGFKWLDDSVQLNPYYQWWFNAGFSFYYFHHAQFENAIYWAEKMNFDDAPWELMIKSAAYAGMQQWDAAASSYALLQQKFPGLCEQIPQVLQTFLLEDTLVQKMSAAIQMIAGLQKENH
jgi:TolB-like protein